MKIRQATLDDLMTVKDLTDGLLQGTRLGVADVDKIARIITGRTTMITLAEHDGEVVGFIGGAVYESPFNSVIRSSDLGLYIKPGTRSAAIGRKLVESYEEWAKDHGATQCWLGQSTGHRVDDTADYYKRLGYQVMGVNSVKDI